jgi:hypothetical protein
MQFYGSRQRARQLIRLIRGQYRVLYWLRNARMPNGDRDNFAAFARERIALHRKSLRFNIAGVDEF